VSALTFYVLYGDCFLLNFYNNRVQANLCSVDARDLYISYALVRRRALRATSD